MASHVEEFENDLVIMDTNCRQLLQNSDFRRIMNQETPTDSYISAGHTIRNDLAVNLYSDSLLPIKEVFYYLPNADYMLSESYFITGDHFYNWIKQYPAPLKEAWFDLMMDEESYYTFVPFSEFQTKSGNKYYLYIMNIDDLYFMDSNTRAIFVVNRDELFDIFGIRNLEDAHFLKIVDRNGKVVLSSDTTDLDLEEAIDSVSFANGFANFKKDDLTIGRYESSETGYTYYYSFPFYDSVADTRLRTFIYVALTISILVLGGSLIVLLSRRNIKPIEELNRVLSKTLDEKSKLEELRDSERPIIVRSYVRQLMLTGVGSDEELRHIREYLKLPADHLYFKAMHLVIYNSGESETDVFSEDSVLSANNVNQIVKRLEEALGAPLLYFVSGEHSVSVLLSCNETLRHDYLLTIQKEVLKLHNEVLERENLWLFAGIGKTTQTLMNIWESYQQAVDAVGYASKNYIFLPYEYIKKDSKSFYYPQEFSNKLIHFVTSGNEAQTLELLRLIRKENMDERSLPVNLMHFLLSDIRNTLLKARFELPASTDEGLLQEIDNKFAEKVSFALCEELAKSLCDIFAKCSNEGNLIEAIVRYIRENYADSLLCLNKISDEFKISETYFSHLFKQSTGENFSTFLETLRMNRAMELIKGGDVALNDVYQMVGYNNQNSFRRAFKKVYGTTPGAVK